MIKKEYQVGMLRIKARINDGFVNMVTNQPQVTRQIFEFQKKAGKQVIYTERVQAVTQFYKDKTEKEIEKLVEEELKSAKVYGQEIFKKIKTKIEEENKNDKP